MKKKNTKKWKKTQKKIKQKQQKDFVYLEQNRCLFIFTLFSILKKSAKKSSCRHLILFEKFDFA